MVPSAFGDESPAFGDQCRVVCIKAGGVLYLRSLLPVVPLRGRLRLQADHALRGMIRH